MLVLYSNSEAKYKPTNIDTDRQLEQWVSPLSSNVKRTQMGLLMFWMGSHLIVELETYVSGVVDLSATLRVFLQVLRFLSPRKTNAYVQLT